MCEQRKSPRCDIDILLVAKEPLLPGDSGAPVFNQQNQVVGIADGGVKGGFALLNWIIPYTDVHLLPVSQFTVFLDFLRQQDLTKLFAQASTLGEDRFPHGHETVITGKVLYGGYYSVPLGVAADYTPADAVIQLWDTETRKEVPVDFTYDHHTGQYSITNVPVGKFSISIRLEAGYPFYKVSGGDFISYLSGLNDNIIVAPYDDQIYRDLKVVKSIHLTRPVNNQEERTFTSDPPEILYKENYYPSASVFKWDPVPGADRYEVTILLHDEATNKNTDIKTISTSQSKLYPALDVNHGHTCYWFSVKALNGNGDMIGYFANYYKNGFGGWFKFKVLEKPYQL
ncbi:MAG TPA: hypothetical protein ENK96_09205 [Desulfobulbaceae bacterium]|nr:hypothetical protein [Desulfobulbaceae bacterium]